MGPDQVVHVVGVGVGKLTFRDMYRTPRSPRSQVSAVSEEGRGHPLTEGHTRWTKATCQVTSRQKNRERERTRVAHL